MIGYMYCVLFFEFDCFEGDWVDDVDGNNFIYVYLDGYDDWVIMLWEVGLLVIDVVVMIEMVMFFVYDFWVYDGL